jgi:hypothetical protein
LFSQRLPRCSPLTNDELLYEGELADELPSGEYDITITADSERLVLLIPFESTYPQALEGFHRSDAPWAGEVGPIDYPEKLREKLEAVWKNVDVEYGYEAVVGHVKGKEITRRVMRYLRTDMPLSH